MIVSFGQHGANQLYHNENSNQNVYQTLTTSANKIRYSQESLTLEVNILNNVQADSYVVTLGVNQESKSVETCNVEINKRISEFTSAVRKLGLSDKDIYIDFISQTKIYDYTSNSENDKININQVNAGFEIKKNIIFRLENIKLFDKIIEIASKTEIHNIINVEYYVLNQDKIYESMLTEAKKVAENKSKFILQQDLTPGNQPVYEISFTTVQPGSQYKKFQAFETSDVSYSNYYNDTDKIIVQQEQRKSNTFYFDGLDTSGFDKIINADTPVVGLQFVMNVKVTYLAKYKF